MKRISLISDTHGHIDDRMLSLMEGSDEVWHAGDFGDDVYEVLEKRFFFRGVYGNIDGTAVRLRCPESSLFSIQGLKVLMIHIAGPFGKYSPQVRGLIADSSPGLLVCGHSHILKAQYDEKHKLLYLNPGAAGKHGFHKTRTMVRFSVSNARLHDMEVVELGARGALT
ncbi:MAG: metallophosphoesterase family protein [Bacteroidota bacterium]